MGQLDTLLRTQVRRTVNGFARGGVFSWMKLFGGLLLSVFFLGWLYYLFVKVLTYFNSVQLLGAVLAEKLLSLIFLTFFGMVFFSNVVYTISTTYLSDDLQLLMSLPLRRGKVLALKFLETLVDSSWMPALLFIPVFLAYGKVFQADALFYIMAFTALLLFLPIPAALGFLSTACLMRFFPARQVRDFFLLTGILGLIVVSLILRLANPEDIFKNPDQLSGWTQYLEGLRAPAAPWQPGAWATQMVIGALYGHWDSLSGGFLRLLGWGLPMTAAALVACRLFFFRGWCHAQESVGWKGARGPRGEGRWEKLFFLWPAPLRAMLVKDIKLFLRDPTQWAQLMLLLSLIVVYLYNYRKLPLESYAGLRNVLFFLSMGFSGFIVSAVGVRYVFPAISLEGRAFWILKSGPMPVRGLLWGKFLMTFVPMAVLSEILTGAAIWYMKVDLFMAVLAVTTMFFMALGLTALGLGLGSIFTYFKVDNAPKISTSLGGYVYVMASVTFITVVLLVEATPVRLYYRHGADLWRATPWEILVPALYYLTLNLGMVALPLVLGAKKLSEREI